MRAWVASLCLVAAVAGCDNPDPYASVDINLTANKNSLSKGDSITFVADVPGYREAPVTWSFEYWGSPITPETAKMIASGRKFTLVYTPEHPDLRTHQGFYMNAWSGPRRGRMYVTLSH